MTPPKSEAGDIMSRLFKAAVIGGVESAVRMHIARGDDIDARDSHGFTPLMLAAARDRATICSMLLEAGAKLSATHPAGRDARGIAKDARAASALAVLEAACIALLNPLAEPAAESEAIVRHSARGESASDADSIKSVIECDDGAEIDTSAWEPDNFAEPSSGDSTLLSGVSAVQRSIADHLARSHQQGRGVSKRAAGHAGAVIALTGRPLPEIPPSSTDAALPTHQRASTLRSAPTRPPSSSPLPRAEDAKAFEAAAALVVRLADPGQAG